MAEHREGILERCFALAGRGDHAGAEALAIRCTESTPDDGAGWVALGLLLYRRDEFAAACSALETAGCLVPLEAPTRTILAECFARTGYPDLAKHVYLALAADARTPPRLFPGIAAGLGWLGEYGAALEVCIDLTRREPAHAEAHFGVAFYLRRLGRPPEAVLPVVARAHELAPEVPLYRISLATLLDHVGRRDEARELLHGLDLDAVSCRCCVQRMTAIFWQAADPAGGPHQADLAA